MPFNTVLSNAVLCHQQQRIDCADFFDLVLKNQFEKALQTCYKCSPGTATLNGTARCGTSCQSTAREDPAQHGTAWHGAAQHSMAQNGTAQKCPARHGVARPSTAQMHIIIPLTCMAAASCSAALECAMKGRLLTPALQLAATSQLSLGPDGE